MTQTGSISLSETVLGKMLDRVRSGEWKPGTIVPSQRHLVNEFGVSGIPLREALSMMKVMGILEIRHGCKTVVRQMDMKILEQLFPLAFCLEGQQSFDQICELRLAVEPRIAALAAERRSDADLDALARLIVQLKAHHIDGNDAFFDSDQQFHLRVAESTGNPLFPLLLKAASGVVRHAQIWGCKQSQERRMRAVWSHESIYDAIANRDSQRAQVEMEAHLRFAATHYSASEALAALRTVDSAASEE